MSRFPGLRFPDHLDLRYVGGDEWKLLVRFRAVWRGGQVTVPVGFVTDLSSIPRRFRSLIPVVGPQNLASVIHDFLYDPERRPAGWTRANADLIFLEGMKAAGVRWMRRRAMYLAVRVGSARFWDT